MFSSALNEIANFFRSARKLALAKMSHSPEVRRFAPQVRSMFHFGYVRNPSDFNQVLILKTCPNMFSHKYHYNAFPISLFSQPAFFFYPSEIDKKSQRNSLLAKP